MSNVRIDPQRVVEIANGIGKGNKRLYDDFSSVKTSVDQLKQVWVSPTASRALPVFEDLRIKYVHRRYETIDAYVTFLKNRVGEGYTTAESDNVSLAEKFK